MFLRIKIILYGIYSKLVPFSFYEKKSVFFFKKPNFRTFREVLLFQSHCTTNLLQLVIKNFHSQKRRHFHFGHNQLAKTQKKLSLQVFHFPSIHV